MSRTQSLGPVMDRRADLLARLAEAENRLAAEVEQLNRAAAEYRSTNDGIAESMRDIELADTPERRRELLQLHENAERDAYTEYEERRDRWGAELGQVTGPLKALPCGSNTLLTRLLLTHRILGSYRYQPDTAEQVVTLLHITRQGTRRRRRFTHADPHNHISSIADAVAVLATRHPERIKLLVGDVTLGQALIAAVATAATPGMQ